MIYSQESPKMEEFIRDFDWDLNRFVEYRSPFRFRVGTEIVFGLK